MCPWTGVALVLALASLTCSGQPVRINEIMYHPAGTNVLEEWFELHNPSPTNLTLTGWRVSKGVSFSFPTNTLLPAGGYLVVAADRFTFEQTHPGTPLVVAGWTGTLSHDGEELRIEDAQGNAVTSVSYAPDGDWAMRRPSAPDPLGKQGWEWFAPHDGQGSSLELVNGNLEPGAGQNWSSSSTTGGTPGAPNSTATTNAAPLILDVSHSPTLPRSTDPVSVTARIRDEAPTGLAVSVAWRVDGDASFTQTPMSDDGRHADGLPGDGVFGCILPPHGDGTVIEFHLSAEDAQGHSRTYPAVVAPASNRSANLAYQVDNTVYAGAQPLLRLIMVRAEYEYLSTQIWGDEPLSDAFVNGTFISTDGILEGGRTTQFRYGCGFRNRGHGTRSAVPHNFHISFSKDRLWKGRAGLNLNTRNTHSQQLGSAMFRSLGVPMADSRPVQVRINAANLAKPGQEQFGSYAANEVVDGRLVERQFPLENTGNLYRGIRDMIPGIDSDANLAWHGPSYSSYTNAYAKENNSFVNDWSDLLRLIDVLNNTPDDAYVSAVRSVANVDEWMKYFAINTLLGNQENSLANGSGDDYMLFRGTTDTRFLLLPYDMDSMMGRGVTRTPYPDGLWRMTNVPAIGRFMNRSEFVPLYFQHLEELARTAFSPARVDPMLDQLMSSYVDASVIATMKAFNSNQVAYVLSLFPHELTATTSLSTSNGYPYATAPTTSLRGTGNPAWTRRVLVNGADAAWNPWNGGWTNAAVALHPGINRILVQALGADGSEVARSFLDVWHDDASLVPAGTTIATNTTWSADGGPYLITGNLTVNASTTLSLQPGTCVYLASGAGITVANGGRILAEGTETAPIRFTRQPGSGASWGGIVINGGPGSPETRIAHAHFEFFGTTTLHTTGATVWLDHLSFGSTDHPYLSLDASSFVVSHCNFPTPSAPFELIHGADGIKPGGRGLFLHNFFGSPTGYNDVIDFTGNNRPGEPLVHFINNVFIGTGDDILDLDGTDAWVEGNIFLHTHKNGSPDSASAVSGGSGGGNTSDITIVRNIFYDCDQAITAKQGNFYTVINNTIVRQTHAGGLDTEGAVANFADDGTSEGAGAYFEGNLIHDIEQLARNLLSAQLTFTNNVLPLRWIGPGGGNTTAHPLLVHIPDMAETRFSSWEEAQIMRRWLSLQPGSPGISTGPNGLDRGAIIPAGIALAHVPAQTNALSALTLNVDRPRTGNGIPAAGFPNGSGYTHFRYRIDGSPWSGEQPATTPIQLADLSPGLHTLDISGKRDTGVYQDDPSHGDEAVVTTARWVVDPDFLPSAPGAIRISEVLARNATTFDHLGSHPDLIELFNAGSQAADLSGMGLSDTPDLPHKFKFPSGTLLPAGAYLVLLADTGTGGAFLHTGFSLKGSGDDLRLTSRPDAPGGIQLVDSVVLGIQLEDRSIGRRTDGTWGLCQPTFGSANVALPTGDVTGLRINEWLADAQFVGRNDFVELFNPDALPVALGGCYLSDASGSPYRHPMAPLSYIAGHGFLELIADGDITQGSDHLNFHLSPDVGLILLSSPDLAPIDEIMYGPQRTDISEGRTPNGGSAISVFPLPTPGGGNPGVDSGSATLVTTTIPLIPWTALWRYNQSANLDGTAWAAPNYNDASWPSGAALLGVEDSALPAPGLKTPLTIGRTTYYFRTSFLVETNLAGFKLNLTTVVDDGVVITLNGTRLLTNGMSTGTPSCATLASRNVNNAVAEYFVAPATGLVLGTNVLAVEVHQTSSGSSDVVWGLSMDASQTITNYSTETLASVVLNEIRAGAAVDFGTGGADAIELFNTSTNEVDLTGMSLSDNSAFPRKWSFPAGSRLPASGFLAIRCDGNQLASTTNTGFGLKAAGGAVFLFSGAQRGGALVDAVRYGLQTPACSIGRTPNGTGVWTLNLPTPGAANAAAGLASVAALRINEWMAEPEGGSDWFELCNTADQPVPLDGLFLTDTLADTTQSPIPPLSFIGTGAYACLRFVADGSPGSGADHTSFSLKKSGEALGLFSASGVMIDGITFGAQTTGVSQGRFPDGKDTIVSFSGTSSPAESNFLPLTNALINEVLTHTDPPLEDAVELFNPTAAALDVGGWYLSNSSQDLKRFRIPNGTQLPAGGFLAFFEAQFNGSNGVPFTFNSAHGDAAILSEADASGALTGFRSQVVFGAAMNGTSFGRHVTSTGVDFTAMRTRTFGADSPASLEEFRASPGLPNSSPLVGPLAVSEIYYLPLNGGAEYPQDEFIEIQNLTPNPVPLFDPAHPTNLWRLRDAVDFEFPRNAVLAAGARLLVVGFDPDDATLVSAFRTRYAVPADVTILGPWSGRLANDHDSVELVRPDAVQLPPHPDAGFVPQVLVDKVRYSALTPWPASAAGGSHSLQRTLPGAYGNDPANWIAAPPTPGLGTPQGSDDSDADGLLDAWELASFGTLARDGTGDFDADGMGDAQEFAAGTDPASPIDFLRIASVAVDASVTLFFNAVGGRSYSVQCRDALGSGTWVKLADIPAPNTSSLMSVQDTNAPATSRFYRLVTPMQP
jgi:hypothetical protein